MGKKHDSQYANFGWLQDFVEAHGGTLTVESEVGKGSCFTLRLKA